MEAFPWPARQIELYRYITGLVVAFGQSFINVCINTREHRELLGWLVGLPLGLGSLLYFAAVRRLLVMQSALHRMLILLKQLVPFTTIYLVGQVAQPASQMANPYLTILTSQSCQPENTVAVWTFTFHKKSAF